MARTGEYTTLQNIVSKQQSSTETCLYSSAVHSDNAQYKLQGYSIKHPFIAAIGSSRMTQFRQEFFTAPFHNLATGQINSVSSLEEMIEKTLEINKPEILLIGLDFWWFLPDAKLYEEKNALEAEKYRFSLHSLFEPTVWMLQRKIKFSDYWNIIYDKKRMSQQCNIGVRAIFQHRGFVADGSEMNEMLSIPGSTIDPVSTFEASEKDAKMGIGRFTHASNFDNDLLKKYRQLLQKLENNGIDIVIVLPPISPNLFKSMENDNLITYYKSLFSEVEQFGYPIMRGHDAAKIGISPCFFLDGIHGHPTAFAMLIKHFAKEYPNNSVSKIIDQTKISQLIDATAGKYEKDKGNNILCDIIENPLKKLRP